MKGSRFRGVKDSSEMRNIDISGTPLNPRLLEPLNPLNLNQLNL